jgi:uncharacterized protein (TIRG00374 family)
MARICETPTVSDDVRLEELAKPARPDFASRDSASALRPGKLDTWVLASDIGPLASPDHDNRACHLMDIPVRARRALILSVVFATAIYATAMIASDLNDVADASGRVGVAGWSIVLALSLVNYGLRFARWHTYLHCLGHRVPIVYDMLLYLAGFALTTTPGKAGEAVRCLFLRRLGVEYTQSLAVLFAERILDLVVISALALALTTAVSAAPLVIAVVVLAIFAALPLFRGLATRLIPRRDNSTTPSDRPWRSRLLMLLRNSAALTAPLPWYGGFLIGLAAWAAEGIGLYFILNLIGSSISMTQSIGVYAASMLVGALSFIPGGIGSTEATMVVLLTLLGVEPAPALAATLICRIATLWFAVALGLLALWRLGAASAQHQ